MSENQNGPKVPEKGAVIITGASGGLGRGAARVFVKRGWDVVMFGRDKEKLNDKRLEIDRSGDNTSVQSADITNFDEVEEIIKQTFSNLRPIKALINIAGVPQKRIGIKGLEIDHWNQVINVNLTGVFHMCKAVFQHMKDQESGGYIINISSVAGRKGMKEATAYTASKGALTAFTQALNEEGKMEKNKIRCSVIYLGGLITTFTSPEPNPYYLEPQDVGEFLFHLVDQAPNMVVNEAVITPIVEKNYP